MNKKLLPLILVLASCVGEREYQAPPAKECEVSIAVKPTDAIRSRLADNATEPQEDLVTRLIILLYQDNKLVYRPVIVDQKDITNGSCTVKLPAITCDMQIITNINDSAESIINSNPIGSAMDSWELKSQEDVGCISTWDGFRMWGVKRGVVISAGVKIANFPLHRMLARIDVQVTGDASATGDFKMKEIRLCNFHKEGYLIPRFVNWDFDANSVGGKAKAPSIPNSTLVAYTSFSGEQVSPKKCLATIYCAEETKATGAGDKSAPYLLVQGEYKGTLGWYRVDFHDGTDYIDLLRNHRYVVPISQVLFPGYSTPDDAASAAAVNIGVRTIAWNDTSLGDVTFDAKHMLSISPTSYTAGNYSASFIATTITTDIYSNVNASDIKFEDPSWLSFDQWQKDEFTVVGDKKRNDVRFIITTNTTSSVRSQWVTINAGKLWERMLVRQWPAAYMSIVPAALNVPNDKNTATTSIEIAYKAYGLYAENITSSANWIKFKLSDYTDSDDGDKKNYTLTLNIAANKGAARSATVTVKWGQITKVIYLNQAANRAF